MRNIGTFRTKSRYKFKKEPRDKGKLNLTRFFQTFEIGEKVHLGVEPSYHKGMYFPRFLGKTGEVVGKKKRCYEVKVIDGNKEKILIVHPIHLKK